MEEENSSIKENNQIPKDCVISWVSVKDALPKNRQKVLFATTNEDVHKAIYMEKLINQYGDYDQVFLSTDGGHYQVFMDIVAFWCDLPKPPPCN
jgi:hypothetical protein